MATYQWSFSTNVVDLYANKASVAIFHRKSPNELKTLCSRHSLPGVHSHILILCTAAHRSTCRPSPRNSASARSPAPLRRCWRWHPLLGSASWACCRVCNVQDRTLGLWDQRAGRVGLKKSRVAWVEKDLIKNIQKSTKKRESATSSNKHFFRLLTASKSLQSFTFRTLTVQLPGRISHQAERALAILLTWDLPNASCKNIKKISKNI